MALYIVRTDGSSLQRLTKPELAMLGRRNGVLMGGESCFTDQRLKTSIRTLWPQPSVGISNRIAGCRVGCAA